jgi:diaminohydroxyphosphoribosylaminopyrimidine deaminase / 5-amino-6-(5-phosphoribosylamino)uracil reductase
MVPFRKTVMYSSDDEVMQRAIRIAQSGLGLVEPNPMVGAVIMDAGRNLIAEGYHQKFGDAHAEINAIREAGEATRGADLFVSLEPCSHFGKTPPCANAVIAAGFRRVVVGCQDPAPHVAGQGIQRIREAGIPVEVGVCEVEARRLIAPFETLKMKQRPWVHAKWAMTLDGRIATGSGHSQWISCEQSRAWVHQLRGRVDAIITGAGTVRADDPLLTARPAGMRTALRVVLDSTGESLTEDSKLVKTVDQAPVLVCVSRRCTDLSKNRLRQLGIEVFETISEASVDPGEVLHELGRRRCTNVMLEAGPRLLGSFFDRELIDEVHAFVAPKLIGGANALSPLGGAGLSAIPGISNLKAFRVQPSGDDFLIQADICRNR